MYWGPRKFSIPVWQVDRELTEKRAAVFDNAFPKFLGARASAQLVVEWGQDDDGESYATYNLDVVVPRRCRAAAIFEDLDYTAPVWLNLLALLFLVWSLKWPKMISISS